MQAVRVWWRRRQATRSERLVMLCAGNADRPDEIARLVRDGADVNFQTRNGNLIGPEFWGCCPVVCALLAGVRANVRACCLAGCDLRVGVEFTGQTALHIAAACNRPRMFAELLANGGVHCLHLRDRAGATPYDLIQTAPDRPAFERLLEQEPAMVMWRRTPVARSRAGESSAYWSRFEYTYGPMLAMAGVETAADVLDYLEGHMDLAGAYALRELTRTFAEAGTWAR